MAGIGHIATTTNKNKLRQNVKAFVAERAKTWDLTGLTLRTVREFADETKLTPGDKMGINAGVRQGIEYFRDSYVCGNTTWAQDERIITRMVVERLFSDKWASNTTIQQRARMFTEGRGIRNLMDEYAITVDAVRRFHKV